MKKDRLSVIYWGMKNRCYKPNHPSYKRYGGRGITICEEWLEPYIGFKRFKKWALENGYEDELTIDRIDVNKDYSPENCRWITNKEQQNNRRDSHIVTYMGKTQTLAQWCEELGLDYDKTQARINKLHWTIEKALGEKSNVKLRMVTYRGETKNLAEWCKELHLNLKTVHARLYKHNWSVEKTFETRPRRKVK